MAALNPDEIRLLSAHERLALIERLWDSLGDADVSLSVTQVAELESRLETFEQDLPQAVTWEDLKAGLAAGPA